MVTRNAYAKPKQSGHAVAAAAVAQAAQMRAARTTRQSYAELRGELDARLPQLTHAAAADIRHVVDPRPLYAEWRAVLADAGVALTANTDRVLPVLADAVLTREHVTVRQVAERAGVGRDVADRVRRALCSVGAIAPLLGSPSHRLKRPDEPGRGRYRLACRAYRLAPSPAWVTAADADARLRYRAFAWLTTTAGCSSDEALDLVRSRNALERVALRLRVLEQAHRTSNSPPPEIESASCARLSSDEVQGDVAPGATSRPGTETQTPEALTSQNDESPKRLPERPSRPHPKRHSWPPRGEWGAVLPQVDYAARSVGERDVTWTLNTLRKVARELGVSAARAAAAYDSRSGEVRAEPYNVRDRPALTMALTLRTLRGELLAGERVNGEFSRPKRWSRPQEPPRPLPPEWPDDDWPGASPQMPGQDALMMSVTRTAPAPAGLEAR